MIFWGVSRGCRWRAERPAGGFSGAGFGEKVAFRELRHHRLNQSRGHPQPAGHFGDGQRFAAGGEILNHLTGDAQRQQPALPRAQVRAARSRQKVSALSKAKHSSAPISSRIQLV